MSKQKTLKGSFSLCGKGLHTGLSLTVTFNPAPENTGYKIQRIDLEGEPVIQAVAENVVETQRGTVLGKGDIRVSTIEHGMSALYALGIDNCLIQVNGPEFPILDGSAAPYVEKIQSVGIQEQNAEKDYYIIRHKIEVKDNNGSVITILPDEDFSITAMCSFESKFINSQFATLDKMETYAEEIASARTFVFVRDIMPLLQANLIKGGDLDNAIVIYERQVEQAQLDQLADHLKVPHMDANKLGYIQHRPLQWENECTRHKLLDIIGDMALIGKPIKGRIIATRPGQVQKGAVHRPVLCSPDHHVRYHPAQDHEHHHQLRHGGGHHPDGGHRAQAGRALFRAPHHRRCRPVFHVRHRSHHGRPHRDGYAPRRL